MNYKCPWCGSEKAQIHLWLKDEFLTNEDFQIYECKSCGLLYTEPRPDKNEIGKYYKSETYYSHQENKKGLIPRLYETVKSVNLKKKYKLATNGLQKGRVLDIGCGVGDFLQQMEKQGWETVGIEPSEEAKHIAEKRVNSKVFNPDDIQQLEAGSFDLITMWHVLEHVDDLKEEIHQLERLLKHKGRLVLALPNFKSYDAQYYNTQWAAYDVPRHLNHFCKESIVKIFRNSELNIVDTDKLKWDAYYISYMSEIYRRHRMPLIRGAYRGMISNCKARKSNEWSSRVYILEKK
ncbi:MAG: class I SAM-dependent methyltransferase [Bacteroidales bacterium]|nr:class I SAM-dependent methyltransferase [Bacteroidales bacterium]